MELKADEDKTYTGGFIAAPTDPWGTSVSANSGGDHGYHVVWTRDEYEMASALLAAATRTDANAALQYIFSLRGRVQRRGQAEQLSERQRRCSARSRWTRSPTRSSWPGSSARRTRRTGGISSQLANYLVSNGPATPQERWEENGGYSPATMAAEIAGLICAASIAETNGATSQAATYQSTALSWASEVDGLTYTTSGSYGNGDYFLRITPGRQPELRGLDLHRQRRRQPRRPHRGGPQLPGTGPAGHQGGHRDRHHQHAVRGGRRRSR